MLRSLNAHSISKSFGNQIILEGITLSLNPGERIGLVGPNGCGKTTLLRILAGIEQADSGHVRRSPGDLHLGYLSQGLEFSADTKLADFLSQFQDTTVDPAREVEQAALALAAEPESAELQSAYDISLARLQEAPRKAASEAAVLDALGLGNISQDTPLVTLSGGQKTRLGLAGVLLSRPHLLLLDEPTNHLDLEMLTWLEDWLLDFPGGVLVVSHDRAFLDRVATGILELDGRTHHARLYPGNYLAYLEQKQAELERHWQSYKDQQVEIGRLQAATRHLRSIARFRKGGKADGGDKFARGFFADRSLGTIGRAKHIERRLEHLLTDEHVDKPSASWQMKVDFQSAPESGKDVLVCQELTVGYGKTPVLHSLNLYLRAGERVALIGPNGCGKTTLLRTLVGEIPALAGSFRQGVNLRPGYMAQEQEGMQTQQNALEMLLSTAPFSETQARAFLHKFLFSGDDVFKSTGSLSYGERARLSLACLVAQGCNFLLLDEPLNHLDIPSRVRFEQALAHFDGTVLVTTHDRYFIQSFARLLWLVEAGSIRSYQPVYPDQNG